MWMGGKLHKTSSVDDTNNPNTNYRSHEFERRWEDTGGVEEGEGGLEMMQMVCTHIRNSQKLSF